MLHTTIGVREGPFNMEQAPERDKGFTLCGAGNNDTVLVRCCHINWYRRGHEAVTYVYTCITYIVGRTITDVTLCSAGAHDNDATPMNMNVIP